MACKTSFNLVGDMRDTVDVIRGFRPDHAVLKSAIESGQRLFLTGEGSSRIFPAKNLIASVLRAGLGWNVQTEGARQAAEYDLSGFTVVGASNSGRTRELVDLFSALKGQGHDALFGLSAHAGTPLEAQARQTWLLTCGAEGAVAATKSVVEQALFYRSLAEDVSPVTGRLADGVAQVLDMEVSAGIIDVLAGASTLYFAGRNDGVAEELTLKTNEITRKKSGYLEGTYAVHGIEETMTPDDVVIVVSPFREEQEKLKATLVDPIGVKVVAIHSEDTLFPTVRIPDLPGFESYLQLVAGWNLLVGVGLAGGVDLDKPQRARKVGNEVAPA